MSVDRKYQTWLFAMLKGGARKTTSAMFTAAALAKVGHEVLVVDADAGTQGVTEWTSRVAAQGGSMPFDVIQWTPRLGLLVPFVIEQQERTGARYVLLDVGGEQPEVVAQAAALADVAVMPVGPETAEIARLAETLNLVRRNPALDPYVLLTRVNRVGMGAAASVRTMLLDDGYRVLASEVPHSRSVYADAFGYEIDDLGAYAELADELVDLGGTRA